MSVAEAAGTFTYLEDTDQAMLELSLQAMGLRQSQQQQQQQSIGSGGNVLNAFGSSLTSPLMQAQGSPSSRRSSPSSQGVGGGAGGGMADAQGLTAQQKQQMGRILQDPGIVSTLRVLRAASESGNLMEIENSLVRLFMMLLSKSLMDASRLSMRHETTGRTLLHFATLLGMRNLASFLVSQGVNVDDAENSGMTALHLAAMYREREGIFELLLNAGASTAVLSGLGQTAGDVAKASGFVHLQRMAEERGGYVNFIKDDNSMVAELGGNGLGVDGSHQNQHYQHHPQQQQQQNVGDSGSSDGVMMRQSLAEMMSQISATGGSSSTDNNNNNSSSNFGGGGLQQ
ncbi:SPT3 Dosage dependent suppressor of Ty-induced promoter mutations-like protein [Coemansia sp. BCRC 34490]|nr:SPT3 Dosage dependent suppressor of Ty-induced promoter mutations-like protein [Coemansia sp. BCRC 34490]